MVVSRESWDEENRKGERGRRAKTINVALARLQMPLLPLHRRSILDHAHEVSLKLAHGCTSWALGNLLMKLADDSSYCV